MATAAIGSTIVADVDQAIYGFRGGDRHNVQIIKERLQAKLITLPENFRSPIAVAEAAQFLVSKETNRADKHYVAMSDELGAIYQLPFKNDQAEAIFVAEEVSKLRNRGSIDDLGQIAVISRNRNRARRSQEALDRRGIPSFDRSRLPFDDSWEANVALAIVDLYFDSNSSDKLFNLMSAVQDSGIAYHLSDQEPIDISCVFRENMRHARERDVRGDNAEAIVNESGFIEILHQISANSGRATD